MTPLHLLKRRCAHDAPERPASCAHPKLRASLSSDLLAQYTAREPRCSSDSSLRKTDTVSTLSTPKIRQEQIYISLTTTISLLSPHAVICCIYFINVLLAVIGLKAAKLHIINNKWAAGCIYCFTGSHAAALEVTQTSLCPGADKYL